MSAADRVLKHKPPPHKLAKLAPSAALAGERGRAAAVSTPVLRTQRAARGRGRLRSPSTMPALVPTCTLDPEPRAQRRIRECSPSILVLLLSSSLSEGGGGGGTGFTSIHPSCRQLCLIGTQASPRCCCEPWASFAAPSQAELWRDGSTIEHYKPQLSQLCMHACTVGGQGPLAGGRQPSNMHPRSAHKACDQHAPCIKQECNTKCSYRMRRERTRHAVHDGHVPLDLGLALLLAACRDGREARGHACSEDTRVKQEQAARGARRAQHGPFRSIAAPTRLPLQPHCLPTWLHDGVAEPGDHAHDLHGGARVVQDAGKQQ